MGAHKPTIHRTSEIRGRAFSARQSADYATAVEFEDEEVLELVREGRAFLEAARSFLGEKSE